MTQQSAASDSLITTVEPANFFLRHRHTKLRFISLGNFQAVRHITLIFFFLIWA